MVFPIIDEPPAFKRVPCGALRYDRLYCRWEGDLHFRSGTCRVYLSENPKRDRKNQPHWFIYAVAGDVRIGVLHWYHNRFEGQINTERPIALFAYWNKDKSGQERFVIHRVKRRLKSPRTPIALYLTPWPVGQQYDEKRWLAREKPLSK